ncbi:glycerophosphodiester phosphodiesterase [Aliagarivorans taiwanensis]|uniref:glycerophosphodiester phosphodiesterase n=1 Tax=Aliagarivorans taiwanensis TaxID=561966 RepID=UPI0004294217|nr:glycerophosphodiester phosphodiesterase family protein [Aliagarivorans taiwanensis]
MNFRRIRHFFHYFYLSLKHRGVALFAGFVSVQSLWLLTMAPLTLAVSGGLLKLYGEGSVANEDLLGFFLSPLGYLLATWLVGMSLFGAFCQHAVFVLLLAQHDHKRKSVSQAIQIWLGRAWLIARFALLQSAMLMGVALCLLFLGRALFGLLLADWDINFYLDQQRSSLWLYVGVLSVVGLPVAVWLLRRWLSWWLALPLAVLSREPLLQMLGTANQLSRGYLKQIFGLNLSWLLLRAVIYSSVIASYVWVIRWLISWISPSDEQLVGVFLLVASMLLTGYLLSFIDSLLYAALQYYYFRIQRRRTRAIGINQHQDLLREERRVPVLVRYVMLAGFVLASFQVVSTNRDMLGWFSEARSFEVMGHRAGGWMAEENSMEGLQAAIELGLPSTEIDIQLTADGRIVVIHDRDLGRLTRSPLVVSQSSLADIQQAFVQANKPAPLPFEDWLAVAEGQIKLNIELKRYDDSLALVDALLEMLVGYPDRVIISSLDTQLLEYTAERMVEFPLEHTPLLALIEAASIGASPFKQQRDMLMVSQRWLSPLSLLASSQAQQKVYVWTVNQPSEVERLFYLGVDGVITDDPEMVLETMDQIRERSELQHAVNAMRHWLSF